MGVSQYFDAILTELGNFGRYQIVHYTLLSLATIYYSTLSISYVFTAAYVPHRCFIEECGDGNETSELSPSWWTQAIPPNSDGDPSSCSMYEAINTTMTTVASSLLKTTLDSTCSVPFDTNSVQTCDQWVFNGTAETIVTEYSLTCHENRWKQTFVGSINGLGRLIGLPLNGYISDRYGRKWVLVYTLVGTSVITLIQSLSPSYSFFVIFEFLSALLSGSIYGLVFIIAMELVSPTGRVVGGGVIVFSYAIGQTLLGLIAWGVQDWNTLLLTLSTPGLLFVSYIWIFPESIRWLMLRDRMDEANKLIHKAAKQNKVKLSDELEAKLVKSEGAMQDDEEDGDPTLAALKQVLHSRTLLIRLATCSFIWITNVFVYYGLSLNSGALAGTNNEYANFILTGIVEAPGYVIMWFGMTRIGRRPTLSLALFVGGIACIAQPFIPTDVSWAQVLLYLIGKITITGALDMTYVFTSEMFPTRLRNSLLSVCSMIGRIGTITAPQTPLLMNISPLLPMVLFGGLALVACLLSFLLPETMNITLPDSVEDAEALKHNKRDDSKIVINSERRQSAASSVPSISQNTPINT